MTLLEVEPFVMCLRKGCYVPWGECEECPYGDIEAGDYDFVDCSYKEER